MTEFKLPELGENIEQGDLVRLMVAPGATVTDGQSVMELETDKAVVEVPSSVSGTVQEIRVKEGDKIKVGQVIFTVDGAEAKARRAACRAGRCARACRRLRKNPPLQCRRPPATAGRALLPQPSATPRLPAPANSSSPNSAKTSRKAIWFA